MSETISKGSLVISKAGRDKDKLFLVVNRKDKIVYLVDGKIRKVNALKKKNIKHIKLVTSAKLNDFADRIEKGEPVSNDKLRRAINTQNKKI